MLVQTSDHLINDIEQFCDLIKAAVNAGSPMLTFGIKPARAASGFGYIKAGKQKGSEGTFQIKDFVEKPSHSKAEEFVNSGKYMWNSGMFLFEAKAFLKEAEKHCPEIY